MRDFRDAKAMAHSLRDALKVKAVETTHSEALELIAKTFGYENWNVLSAKIEEAKTRARDEGALSPAGATHRPSHATLYCTFCGKSQHEVRKLIAGPLVYICDECVELCVALVNDEDPFWSFFKLLSATETNGNDAYAAALEDLRGRSTEDVTTFMGRSRRMAEHNSLVMECIRRKLTMRPGEQQAEDDVLRSPQFAYLNTRSKEELVALRREAQDGVKRCEAALRIGTTVLAEREPERGA
jgi:hypothetical protein